MPRYFTPTTIIFICFVFLAGCQEKKENVEGIKEEVTKVQEEQPVAKEIEEISAVPEENKFN